MGLMSKIFGTYSDREVKRIMPVADKIIALESQMGSLSDEELRNKTEEFKERLSKGETLDDILVEAFAVCREGAYRAIGLKPYKVQLIGGIVLHQGRISEMKTGEGKTLVATLPAYLNALAGKGVHIVTVNDYLAKRDKEQMGKVFEFLGLTAGVILHNLNNDERREAYNCDITYGTNSELGFDYLRDNMVVYKEERVQRKLNYAIVDEVDSILIDEARTPLIISGQGEKSTDFYKVADYFTKTLKIETDFTLDEKTKAVLLTDEGIQKAEKFYHLENYADADNMHVQHHTVQALKANFMMKEGVDYLVREEEVMIVDEFTGRVMEGRRYSDGLHQAIEAKEGVKVQKESKTLATITYQNYFRMYKKLSGMTGTAQTEEVEFREIYGLDVVVIPTNRAVTRIDQPDLVYKTEMGKFIAVVKEIEETHKKGQPMLVGTVSIEKSELLSSLLRKKGIPHQVLNAKYHEKEAEIISHAGERGMVTIATNMAGRGTDIKLGEGVIDLGGLKIIGTERHESRRIDNQLRGRAGRQGDAGESRFYISLEDDLMRIFGSDRIKSMVDKLGLEDDEAIESKMVSNAIESAQKKVEGNNFDVRKSLIKYDDVMNLQREIIYEERSRVLEGEDIKEHVLEMVNEVVDAQVGSHLGGATNDDRDANIAKLLAVIHDLYLPQGVIDVEDVNMLNDEELKDKLKVALARFYDIKEAEFGEQIREIERVILLKVVDTKWMDHIDSMDHLKQYIGLRAYKQQDPTQAYQFEGSAMFDEMIYSIKEDTTKYLFHIQVQKAPEEREKVAVETSTNQSSEPQGPIKREEDKIGRNDACPCGSGKKYKNCCGRMA